MSQKPYPDKHPCRWARQQLEAIIALDRDRPDALPGSVVRLVKQARALLKKRNEPRYNKKAARQATHGADA